MLSMMPLHQFREAIQRTVPSARMIVAHRFGRERRVAQREPRLTIEVLERHRDERVAGTRPNPRTPREDEQLRRNDFAINAAPALVVVRAAHVEMIRAA